MNEIVKRADWQRGGAIVRCQAEILLASLDARTRIFGDILGANESGWVILLNLKSNTRSNTACSISRLSDQSKVPLSTTLRWLAHFEQHDLVWRGELYSDHRVRQVSLTLRGQRMIDEAIAAIFEIVKCG